MTKVAAAAMAGMLALASLPAEAQLIHRNRDGTVSINPLLCLTDYQVRRAIAAEGFTNIYLNAAIEAHMRARATRNGKIYIIDFNICTGRIVSIQRFHSAR
ncbi:MAG: hypothetical protein P4M09_13680 [Devosia sp.]|nr:hypothetical protein [Devosia sp.]